MKKNYKSIAKQLGSRGGKKSVKVRFKGKSKKEISDMMKDVRARKIAKLFKEVTLDENPHPGQGDGSR